MFYIIDTSSQLDDFKTLNEKECFVQVITSNSFHHPNLSKISLIYFKTSNKGYIIGLNHYESFNEIKLEQINDLFLTYDKIFVLDKKFHLYFFPNLEKKLIDVNLLRNNVISHKDYNTTIHNILYNRNILDPDKYIPISKHYEKWEKIYENIKFSISSTSLNSDFENILINVFYNIEKNGLKVDNELFSKYHSIYKSNSLNNVIYTYYNLYNNTTRPTNSFNNINFLSLTKDSKKHIIPRNNILIEFDFKEYHPRIIAKLSGFNINEESIYEYIKEKLSITREEAKKLTFKQLYGGIEDEYLNIDFFKNVSEFTDLKWNEYQTNKFLKTLGNKSIKIEDENKNKLLNYYIQSSETYYNVLLMDKINKILINKNSKLIHYTYDSFLFDVNLDEKEEFLEIKNLFKNTGFPIKISYGENYKDMSVLN